MLVFLLVNYGEIVMRLPPMTLPPRCSHGIVFLKDRTGRGRMWSGGPEKSFALPHSIPLRIHRKTLFELMSPCRGWPCWRVFTTHVRLCFLRRALQPPCRRVPWAQDDEALQSGTDRGNIVTILHPIDSHAWRVLRNGWLFFARGGAVAR